MKKVIESYIFLLPFFLIFIVFLAFPVFYALWLSLHKVQDFYDVFGSLKFVGFLNYINLLKDYRFWWSLLITLYYSLLTIPVGIFFSLLLASFLTSKLKGYNFFRTLYFLPYILDVFVVGIVWTLLYSSPYGIITRLLSNINLNIGGLLSNPKTALPSVAFAMVLKNAGFGMVLFLATMQNISPSLYEAAMIDGANPFQRFRYITIPSLKPVILFLFITGFIGTLSSFAEFFSMTGGGPGIVIGGKTLYSTETTGLYLYRRFESLDLGYAASISFVLLLITMAYSIFASRFMRERL
uniref:Sugar ABC transporter permease n=1 Tax=candidate division WOR-3 bacterium TaxID=2052148 RepID=A0A7C4UDU7_UNCW3